MSACEIALHSQLSTWDGMTCRFLPFIHVQTMFQYIVLDDAYLFLAASGHVQEVWWRKKEVGNVSDMKEEITHLLGSIVSYGDLWIVKGIKLVHLTVLSNPSRKYRWKLHPNVTGPNSPEWTIFRSTPHSLSLLNMVANDRDVPDSLVAHARSLEWWNLPSWKLSKLRKTLSHSRSTQFTIFQGSGLVCANDTLPLWPWHLLHTNLVK